jgi:hypothetical protein
METTSPKVAALAAKGLADPASLTPQEIRQVCASALTQAPDADEVAEAEPAPQGPGFMIDP